MTWCGPHSSKVLHNGLGQPNADPERVQGWSVWKGPQDRGVWINVGAACIVRVRGRGTDTHSVSVTC